MLRCKLVLRVTLVFLTACASTVRASEPSLVSVRIPDECKELFYPPDFVTTEGKVERQKHPSYQNWDPSKAKAFTYRDPRTSLVLYVETDGRHLAAVDSTGKLLWVRDPFREAHLCPYRTPMPVIGLISAADTIPESITTFLKSKGVDFSHKFLELQFDSSQFGLIDEITGDFYLEGQN